MLPERPNQALAANSRKLSEWLILFSLGLMMRLMLIGCIGLFVACASGPPDLPPGSGFPRDADVDPRLNLNGADRIQIARLVAAETSERISMVWRAGNPNRILVTCGQVNLVHPKPFSKGTGFMMQRIGSTWRITDRPAINTLPSTPSLAPIEGGPPSSLHPTW